MLMQAEPVYLAYKDIENGSKSGYRMQKCRMQKRKNKMRK